MSCRNMMNHGAVPETAQREREAADIPFERRRGTGRTRRISIRVFRDGRVQVTAPARVSDTAVRAEVQRHAAWIRDRIRQLRARPAPVRLQYISGECHYWQGSPLVLQIREAPGQRPQVCLAGDRLEVVVPAWDRDKVRKRLLEWYRAQARQIFAERLALMQERTPWVKSRPPLRIRAMRRRWGSCSASGEITLNLHLLKAPLALIDYVILHELCHIAEHNHSPSFYRLQSQVLPDWKSRKAQLDDMTWRLLEAD